jgi:hypothetical protein
MLYSYSSPAPFVCTKRATRKNSGFPCKKPLFLLQRRKKRAKLALDCAKAARVAWKDGQFHPAPGEFPYGAVSENRADGIDISASHFKTGGMNSKSGGASLTFFAPHLKVRNVLAEFEFCQAAFGAEELRRCTNLKE